MTVDDVLCIRRHQPTRLEGFVDASFAFAVTLLMISIGHLPSSVPEMLHAMRGTPAFALCFLSLARGAVGSGRDFGMWDGGSGFIYNGGTKIFPSGTPFGTSAWRSYYQCRR